MRTRTARARWEDSLKDGQGAIDFGNGMFRGPYSFGSRFEDRAGTNPEELLGAVHAGCFAMALSLVLGEAGFTPEFVDAIAHVTVKPQERGFKILQTRIVCEATVPGVDPNVFLQRAEAARQVVLCRRPSQAPRSRSKPGS
jgi:osmotically inducible protein OsmC